MEYISEADATILYEALPTLTDDAEIEHIDNILTRYKAQQEELGMPLWPDFERKKIETAKAEKEKINSLYTDLNSVTKYTTFIDGMDTDENRADYAIRELFKSEGLLTDDSLPEEYENVKLGFADKVLNIPKNEFINTTSSNKAYYEKLKGFVAKRKSDEENAESTSSEAFLSASNNEDYSTAYNRVKTLKGDAFNKESFDKVYNAQNNLLKPYRNDISSFLKSIENEMTGKATDSDKSVIADFSNKLSEMPTAQRKSVLSAITLLADKRGKEVAGDKWAIQEFGESFSRLYNSAIFGGSTRLVEKSLRQIPTKGTVITTLNEIKTPEDADKFVSEYLRTSISTAAISERPSLGEPLASRASLIDGKELTIDETSKKLIEDAKKRVTRKINVSREVDSLKQIVDPMRDSVQSTIASTIGTSFGVLPLSILPGGAVLASKIYSDLEYNELRKEYPNMSPENAEAISIVSGSIQGALDKLNIKVAKTALPNVSKLLASPTSINKTVAKTFAKNVTSGFAFENLIEGAQDASTPLVQEFFSAISTDVPEVDFNRELKEWKDSRGDVAIGLAPLVILGAGGAASVEKINAQKILKDAVENINKLESIGIIPEDRAIIVDLMANGKQTEAEEAFRTAYGRRDLAIVQTSVENSNIAQETFENDVELAKNIGLIPDVYVAGNDVVVASRDKNNKLVQNRFKTQDEAMEFALTSVNDSIERENTTITELLKDFNKIEESNLTRFDSNVVDNLSLLGKLSGISQNNISSINDIFGTTAENNDLVSRLAVEIFNNTIDSKKLVDQFSTLILNNAPENIINELTAEANNSGEKTKAILSNLITSGKAGKTKELNFILNRARTDIGRIFASVSNLKKSQKASVESGVDFTPEMIGEELETTLPIVTNRAFQKTVEKRKTEFKKTKELSSEMKELVGFDKDIVQYESERRNRLYKFSGRLNRALTSDIKISDIADANAILDETMTIDEVKNLSTQDKINKVKRALEVVENELNISNKFVMDAFISRLRNLRDSGKIKEDVKNRVNVVLKAFETSNPEGRASQLYNELYDENGRPNIKEGFDFYNTLQEYYAVKFLAGIEGKNNEQITQARKFLVDFFNNASDNETLPFFENLKTDLETVKNVLQKDTDRLERRRGKLAKSIKTISKSNWLSWFIDINRTISTYLDQHLAFASLLEVIFPTDGSVSKRLKRIEVLTAKLNDKTITETEFTELETLKSSMGKSIHPTVQKISDDINDALNNVQLETEKVEDVISNDFKKIFDLKSKSMFNAQVKNTRVDLNNIDKGITVKINGKNEQLSQSFAGYILAIKDQNMFDEQLEKAGFTSDVLNTIRKTLPKEVIELKDIMVKRIREEMNIMNDEYKKIFGFGMPVPRKNFFPVQGKNRKLNMVTAFDLQYQSGAFSANFTPIDSENELELDLSLTEQSANLITMFDSFMYQSIYKRNLMGPVLSAKNILTDEKISDTIEESFGRDYMNKIKDLLLAFEQNGIRDRLFDANSTRYLRKVFTNTSRTAMGFRLSTMIINSMSAGNTLMDSSIPLPQAIWSYVRVIALSLIGNTPHKKGYKNTIMRDRMRLGSSILNKISKSQTLVERSTLLSEMANISLTPMSKFDAFAGQLAAMAAFDAHWRMAQATAKASGTVLSEQELADIATEGMARTITKTFQPTTIAGRASYEISGNPFIKLFTLFLSEARKTVALEIAVAKKSGIFSAEFMRMFMVNHIIIGGLTSFIRMVIKDMFSPEDEDDEIYDVSKIFADMAIGPLGGLMIAGTVLQETAYGIHNLILSTFDIDDKQIRIFSSENPISKSAKSVMTGTKDMAEIFEGDSDKDLAETMFKTVKALSPLAGSSTVSGLTTIANIVEQSMDITEMKE